MKFKKMAMDLKESQETHGKNWSEERERENDVIIF